MRTIFGVFDRFDQARRAQNDFVRAGLETNRIGMLTKQPDGETGMLLVDVPELGKLSANNTMRDMLASFPKPEGSVRGMLMRLGVPAQELDPCTDAIKRGAILEAVAVDDAREADARAIMNRYASSPANDVEEIVIPVIREQFEVGAREVDAGGVRISSRSVREVPVEDTITIREERVTVERRVIDRPVGDAEDAYRERTFELGAVSEAPVVTKHAHVVEEIRVHKDRSERVENFKDTLRHTDVRLSDLPSERGAYDYGAQLSKRGGDWSETDVKTSWEKTNPGTWDRFKDSILSGWQSLKKM